MVRDIVICGMGGSALPGYALDSYSLVKNLPFRVLVWSSYGFPKNLAKNALVFCVSYSGNTEETLSSFLEAIKGGYKVFAVSSGGKLEVLAKKYGAKIIKIKPGTPPRLAIAPMTESIVETLNALKIIRFSPESFSAFKNFNPSSSVRAKNQLIIKLANSIPLVYTPYEWYAIGHIWKIAFNETAKIPAFSYAIPEANHNEMEGFAEKPSRLNKNFHALFLDFEDSNPRIRLRINLSKKVWQKSGIKTTHLKIPKDEFWKTFFKTVEKGYAISRQIAILRKIDPSSTRIIEEFKKWIAKK